MNSIGFIETLWQDLRYGARILRRTPTFAAVAILTLALGTGANTAIFQLVDAVRLRTLPVERPEQLAEVRIVKPPNGRPGSFMGRWPRLTYPLYLKINEQQQVFTDVGRRRERFFDRPRAGHQVKRRVGRSGGMLRERQVPCLGVARGSMGCAPLPPSRAIFVVFRPSMAWCPATHPAPN